MLFRLIKHLTLAWYFKLFILKKLMTMRKILFTLLLMGCFGRLAMGQDYSKIDQELVDEISFRKGDDPLRVNIVLKAQYDQFEMRKRASACMSKEAKRTFVVDELKRFSKESQENIMDLLTSSSRNIGISDIKSFWVSNAINCYATVEMIWELSTHPDVEIIGWDKVQSLLPEREEGRSVVRADEISYNVLKVNAPEVWEQGFTGKGVVVGLVDSGVNYNHEDIKSNMWTHPDYPNHGYDFVNNDDNPFDDNGHGSHCAGTIAGTGASGMKTGIAPSATIIAIKSLNQNGGGTLSQICSGVEFGIEQKADILSISITFRGGGTISERIQFRNIMINALETGIIASVAAGNDGERQKDPYCLCDVPNNVGLPGNCPPPWRHPDQPATGALSAVLCIGATDQNDEAAPFSSRGPATWSHVPGFKDYPYNPGLGLIRPDVSAPGVDVPSLDHTGNHDYKELSGTSMATPCVAGIMALMLSKNPNLTPEEVARILETTAAPLSTKKNNATGSGRVDALAAVNAVPTIAVDTFSIDDTQGNNDGQLNPGETATIALSLKNMLTDAVKKVEATLSTENTFVTINNATADFGDFSAGQSKTVADAFSITLSANAAGKEEVRFALNITSENSVDNASFEITVHGDAVSFSGIAFKDHLGNMHAHLEQEEIGEIVVFIKNEGDKDTPEFLGDFASDSSCVASHATSEFYGVVHQGHYKYRSFVVGIDCALPEDFSIPMSLVLSELYGKKTITLSFAYDGKNTSYPAICNPVSELDASLTEDMVNISWDIPEGDPPKSYAIYHDHELVEVVSAPPYSMSASGSSLSICVEALYANGCTSEPACKSFDFTGIEETEHNVRIYPNPASHSINIQADNIKTISIYNMMGQLIEHIDTRRQVTTISTASYIPNMYLMEITTNDNLKINKRFVVAH